MDHTIESKFSFLFEPIKDLAINFNIDLNHHLEHYLNQLESADALVKNASNSINFVEAAFILRGSAAVYSKKVDYLYSLTLKILEMLTESQQNTKSITNEEVDNNVDPLEMDEMSTLDNIDVSKNLFCKDEVEEVSLNAIMPLSLQKVSNHHNNIQPEDTSCGNNFMINKCKIINSTLLLNHSEMKSLISSVHCCNNTSKTRIVEGENSYFGSVDIVYSSNEDYSANMEDQLPEAQIHMEIDDMVDEKNEESPIYINTVEAMEHHKKDKMCELLDPYKIDHTKFVRNVKKGVTFKLPQSLSSNKKIKRPPIGAIEKYHKSRVVQLEREFEDMLIVKKPTKAKQSCNQVGQENYENLQDYQTAVGGDDDDDDDAMYTQDFHILNASNHGQEYIDPQSNFPDHEYSVLSCKEVMDLHMAQFFKKADGFKIMSDLSEKVQEWESKIVPVLEQEERVGPFDINEYSLELMHQLKTLGGKVSPVSFFQLVACSDKKDVCKIFMSVLHLVNQQKIEVNSYQEMNCFQLKLIQ